MNENFRRGLLSMKYRLHGRGSDGIDCLGVVWLIQNHERNANLPDPWTSIGLAWEEGLSIDAATGLPSQWKKVSGKMQDGDIALFYGEHTWCATLHDGHVWSAHPQVGVWSKPIERFKKTPNELWRINS